MATEVIFSIVVSFYDGSNKIHPSTRPIRHIPVPVGPYPTAWMQELGRRRMPKPSHPDGWSTGLKFCFAK
jgi:hypothetical protein